ncbi:MAG TPA: DsbA family protein [Steroidobacteraceae bacterium]|nr:DsbA family protein [Steroidobacteraceae bacterium]
MSVRTVAVVVLSMIASALLVRTAPAQEEIQHITRAGLKQMLENPGTEAVGAAKPDVLIVEYFDYNCPYCKKLVPVLKALLAQDHGVAILYKDWPILGDMSMYGAASALAAGWQGKYLAAHDALISGPRLVQTDQVDGILQMAGIDIDRLTKDRTAHAAQIAALLARNDEEAGALTLKGTPGLVVGRQFVPGIVDLPALKKLVANSRREK